MKLRLPKTRRSEGGLDRRAVDELIGDRSPIDAIAPLMEANRELHDPEIERRLLELRHGAFSELDGPGGVTPSAPAERPAADDEGLPALTAEELSADAVRAAILGYGSVLVRGLISAERAASLKDDLDRAFEARDAHVAGRPAEETSPWFEPFEPAPEYDFGKPQWNRFKRGGGSVWAADSPRVMFELLDAYESVGLTGLIEEYIGERPALSMHKSVLRRVTPDTGTDWHQDGAFLGEGIRTINVWLALTACGRDAPGLDVVPRRFDDVLETGTEGAIFDWAISPKLVDEILDGVPPARPTFAPGDAILFDELNLHRTAAEPEMTGVRYATETWCFAPSVYPPEQVPFVV